MFGPVTTRSLDDLNVLDASHILIVETPFFESGLFQSSVYSVSFIPAKGTGRASATLARDVESFAFAGSLALLVADAMSDSIIYSTPVPVVVRNDPERRGPDEPEYEVVRPLYHMGRSGQRSSFAAALISFPGYGGRIS